MNHLSAFFTNHKGEKRSYSYWEESSKSYNKVIILVHGLSYHAHAYPFLTTFLISEGYKVYALDLSGFGKDLGDKGAVDDFNIYLDDLESFRRFIKKTEGYREIIFLGHSLGAVVTLAFHLRYPEIETRTILASMLLESYLFDEARKEGTQVKVNLDEMADDKARVKMLKEDDLIVTEITSKLFIEIEKRIINIKENKEKFKPLKLLFLHGEYDKITPVGSIEAFYASITCKRKEIQTFPRMLHDIFAEQRRNQVFDALNLWLSETDFEHKAP